MQAGDNLPSHVATHAMSIFDLEAPRLLTVSMDSWLYFDVSCLTTKFNRGIRETEISRTRWLRESTMTRYSVSGRRKIWSSLIDHYHNLNPISDESKIGVSPIHSYLILPED